MTRLRLDRRTAGRGVARLLLLACLVAYLRWLTPALSPYAAGADAAGYLWSARLFQSGQLSVAIERPPDFPPSIPPDVFAPLGTTVRGGRWELVPTYPTGFPLHLAAMSRLTTESRAVTWTLAVIVGATIWLTYRLGRTTGLERTWAALGAALLGLSPLFLLMAVQPLSDVAATLWALAAVLAAWAARRRAGMALLAGGALGIATLVRPTNLALAVALLAVMPWSRGRVSRLVAGFAPFALGLAIYQTWCYGAPWRSGYGDVTGAFALATLPQTLRHYAAWLPQLASWVIVLAPGALWVWRDEVGRWRTIAAAWILSILGVYAFYYHTSETWWYLRFVLPALPPLVVAGLATCQEIVRRAASLVGPPRRPFVSAGAFVLVAGMSLWPLIDHPLFARHRDLKTDERLYAEVVKWMTLRGDGRQPVLMVQLGGAALYYAPQLRQLRLDRISAGDWQALRRWQTRTGLPIDAALFPFEHDDLFVAARDRLTCDWETYDVFRSVTFWRCPPPKRGRDEFHFLQSPATVPDAAGTSRSPPRVRRPAIVW